MSTEGSLGNVLKRFFAIKNLAAGAIATGIAVAMDSGNGIGEKILTVGLPTLAGAEVANLVDYEAMKYSDGGQEGSITSDIIVALVGGGAAAGIILATGQSDGEGIAMLAGIAGGSILLSDMVIPKL